MIDTTEPIKLPFICTKSVKRVKDCKPVPTICDCCGSPVRLAHNAEVYGKRYGDWPYLYLCRNTKCRARVGLHPKTDLPLGTMADHQTRFARQTNKAIFLTLLNFKFGDNKKQAYTWLAGQLKIKKEFCHFGMFDLTTCYNAGKICKDELEKIL